MSGYRVINGAGHIDDGALVAMIDGELDDPRVAEAHLGMCDVCRERLVRFRDAAGRLRSSMAPVSVPPMALPARRRLRWSYPAIAAASLLIVASVAAATPIASWIMQRLTTPPGAAPAPANPLDTPSSVAAPGIIASFAPTDTVLVIRIDQRQGGGAVHLLAVQSDRISAQAVSGSASEELMVLPAEVRIVNSASSTAEYRISVPAAVRVVHVLVSGREVEAVRVHPRLDHRISLR